MRSCWASSKGMSSTRSLVTVNISVMPRAYHNSRNLANFERTMSYLEVRKSNLAYIVAFLALVNALLLGVYFLLEKKGADLSLSLGWKEKEQKVDIASGSSCRHLPSQYCDQGRWVKVKGYEGASFWALAYRLPAGTPSFRNWRRAPSAGKPSGKIPPGRLAASCGGVKWWPGFRWLAGFPKMGEQIAGRLGRR